MGSSIIYLPIYLCASIVRPLCTLHMLSNNNRRNLLYFDELHQLRKTYPGYVLLATYVFLDFSFFFFSYWDWITLEIVFVIAPFVAVFLLPIRIWLHQFSLVSFVFNVKLSFSSFVCILSFLRNNCTVGYPSLELLDLQYRISELSTDWKKW